MEPTSISACSPALLVFIQFIRSWSCLTSNCSGKPRPDSGWAGTRRCEDQSLVVIVITICDWRDSRHVDRRTRKVCRILYAHTCTGSSITFDVLYLWMLMRCNADGRIQILNTVYSKYCVATSRTVQSRHGTWNTPLRECKTWYKSRVCRSAIPHWAAISGSARSPFGPEGEAAVAYPFRAISGAQCLYRGDPGLGAFLSILQNVKSDLYHSPSPTHTHNCFSPPYLI